MIAGGVEAATVDPQEAQRIARDFFAERGIHKDIILSDAQAHRSRASVTDDTSPYYIYNAEGGGYVVIAGDDRARTILAYSDSGSLSLTSMPEACAAWLELYAGEIRSLSDETMPAAEADMADSFYPTSAVSPLLVSRWDQNDPYNALCPVDSRSGQLSATGCVATATAQVMYYHRYPERPTGTVSYEDKTQGVTRTFDFSTIPSFDWADMTDTYGAGSTEAQRTAVATLMKAVGYASNMQYGSDVSIAYHRTAGEALAKYFGYDSNLHFYERRLMSDKEWIDLLYAELSAGRPVIYDGKNPSAGHTFVCDGYDGKGLFHFNWGWSGLSDGYFSLSALNPGSQSTGGSDGGYTLNQSMVCRIAPAGAADSHAQTDWLMTIYDLNLGDASAYHVASQTPSLTTSAGNARLFFYSFNNGFPTFDGEVWAAATDGGEIRPVVKANPFSPIAGGGYGPMIFSLFEAGLAEGTHTIEFFYRLTGSDAWHPVSTSVSAPSGCFVTVKGDEMTLVPFMRDASSIIFQPAGSLGYSTMDVADSSLSLSASSLAAVAFHGPVYGYVMRKDGTPFPGCLGGKITVNGMNNVVTLDVDGLELEAGDYPLYIYSDIYRQKHLASVMLRVTDTKSAIADIADDTNEVTVAVVSGNLTVRSSAPVTGVTLTDMSGRTQMAVDGGGACEVSVAADSLAPGVYVVTVRTSASAPVMKKVILR